MIDAATLTGPLHDILAAAGFNDRFLILRRAPTRLAEVRPRTLPCGCRTRVVGLGERVRFETDSSRCQYVTQQEATCEES